ncbi:uncharacterized protein LOC130672465 [Microplitis mediator]|uniref:uncharacterized protein LOC130672465 n=1 Tax=Microplitis mediator TaxID=375433 RepID=UPI0025564598|nr:uncharacterized protein LOC130672465 [Microplitis mediator]
MVIMMGDINLDADRLIDEVYKRPALWNNKDLLYHSRDLTNRMWMEISTIFKCPKPVLKSKWKGLRDTFRGEIKKEQNHRQSKYTRRNRWVHYKKLQFLKEQMLPRPPIWERSDDKNDRLQSNNNDDDNNLIEQKLNNGRNNSEVNDENNSNQQEKFSGAIIKNQLKKPVKLKLITAARRIEMSSNGNKTAIHSPVIYKPDSLQENEFLEAISVKDEPVDSIDNCMGYQVDSDNSNGAANEEVCNSDELSMDPLDENRLDDNYYFLMSLLPHIRTLPAERVMSLRMQMQELVYKEVYKKSINPDS